MKKLLIVGMMGLVLSSCVQDLKKQDMGAVLGGIGGAVAGSQFGKGRGQLVGVAAGTMLGALLGSQIGASLDKADRLYASRTTQTALESAKSGQVASWQNPDTGHSGTVVPIRTYEAPSGGYCREFQQTINVGGRSEKAYGTACRQPDGQWKIMN